MTATINATINDTKETLDAAERELRDLLAEEANGPALLRAAGRSGDIAAVRGQQSRQAIIPILIPAARERLLRARLAHQGTERAAAEAELIVREAESQRRGDELRAAEAAVLAARQACYGPGLLVSDTTRRLEMIADRRLATVRELAALLDLEVGDDGELCGKADDNAA